MAMAGDGVLRRDERIASSRTRSPSMTRTRSARIAASPSASERAVRVDSNSAFSTKRTPRTWRRISVAWKPITTTTSPTPAARTWRTRRSRSVSRLSGRSATARSRLAFLPAARMTAAMARQLFWRTERGMAHPIAHAPSTAMIPWGISCGYIEVESLQSKSRSPERN
jgi:hypothetical protein